MSTFDRPPLQPRRAMLATGKPRQVAPSALCLPLRVAHVNRQRGG
jgi:hypothetical protein